MGRKKKEINKDGAFQTRFRELYQRSGKTHEALAKALEVSRPTITGWLDGKSIPDIDALARIAQHFHVSADYLLGLSDMVSFDVSLKAAAEYTGLSEKAVNRLHVGFDGWRFDGVKITEKEKKQILSITSDLIQSPFFKHLVYNLMKISQEAYYQRVLFILQVRHLIFNQPKNHPRTHHLAKKDRDIAVANLIDIFEEFAYFPRRSIPDRVNAMDDPELKGWVIHVRRDLSKHSDLRQFHMSKAFSQYIDRVIYRSNQRAENHFQEK